MKTCCGCTLQELAKIILIVDIIIATINTIFIAAAIIIEGELNGFYISLLVCVLLFFLLEFYLFNLLRRGANDRIYTKCKIWIILRALLLLIYIATVVYKVVFYQFESTETMTCLRIVWCIFELIVVRRFMNEINEVNMEAQPDET